MIWSIIYLVAVLCANYTAIWFVSLPVFGKIAIGTLLFGITFTARDYVHEQGRVRVYTMIFVAALSSAGLSLTGAIDWRIVIASVLSIVISETADTESYQILIAHRWFVKVAGSNLISIPLDSLFFNFIAFAGVFPLTMLVSIIFGEVVVKFTVGLLVGLWRPMVNKVRIWEIYRLAGKH